MQIASWPHQVKALAEVQKAIDEGVRRILVTSPTGGGKTRLAMQRMVDSGRPSVFYTHRRMLLDQTSANFESHGIFHGVRASGAPLATLHDVQLAMIQSEHNAVYKAKSRKLHEAREIFIDEAHCNKQKQATTLIDDHECTAIGLTATPLGIGHLYDRLIVAGTNKQLRECGAHVPSYVFAPDEPDAKLTGRIKTDDGVCGIELQSRMRYAKRVFGGIVQHYNQLNPDRKPAMLFAPGVPEAMWLCDSLNEAGITAASIDGEKCLIDGEEVESTPDVRAEIERRCKSGDINVVCNRFVLREGVDWPWIEHLIFATVFGSLQAFLQAGGRGLRASPDTGKQRLIVQDHGGNWWRHGSLNVDREWSLDDDDGIKSAERMDALREKREQMPIHCPRCNAIRSGGGPCWSCGYMNVTRTRPVLQIDGTLKPMTNNSVLPRRRAAHTKTIEDKWAGRIHGIRKSKNPRMASMTFAQVEANFARENNWQFPPRTMRMQPKRYKDWFRPVQSVPADQLT